MWHIIIALMFVFCPVSVLFSASAKDTFYMEEGKNNLPKEVEALLNEFEPDMASDCGFSGKEMFLSNPSNDSRYYAIAPGHGRGCFGNAGTVMWVASLKDKKAKLLVIDFGTEITKLKNMNNGLHDLKITGGGMHDYKANVWAYNGSKYELISKKFFEDDDCSNEKSKDPDFPWICDNQNKDPIEPAPLDSYVAN